MPVEVWDVQGRERRGVIAGGVKAGLTRARAMGTVLGRPRVGIEIEERIRALAAQGLGKVKIARELDVGVSVTQRVLAPSNTR